MDGVDECAGPAPKARRIRRHLSGAGKWSVNGFQLLLILPVLIGRGICGRIVGSKQRLSRTGGCPCLTRASQRTMAK